MDQKYNAEETTKLCEFKITSHWIKVKEEIFMCFHCHTVRVFGTKQRQSSTYTGPLQASVDSKFVHEHSLARFLVWAWQFTFRLWCMLTKTHNQYRENYFPSKVKHMRLCGLLTFAPHHTDICQRREESVFDVRKYSAVVSFLCDKLLRYQFSMLLETVQGATDFRILFWLRGFIIIVVVVVVVLFLSFFLKAPTTDYTIDFQITYQYIRI